MYYHMVVGSVDDIFHALADGTRRDIVERTLQAEYSVSALARLYPMTFAAVQKHVVVLERATLVTKRKQGREMLVKGNVEAVRRAARLLDELESVWRGRIGRMAEMLGEDPA
jgi:DNA-binding transcriptional ArsR family regulator